MQSFLTLLEDAFTSQTLIEAVFPRCRIRPIRLRNQPYYQVTHTIDKKARHHNIAAGDILDFILQDLLPDTKQFTLFTSQCDFYFIKSKTGDYKVHRKKPTKATQSELHNRAKAYLLSADPPLPFLVELGIVKPNGTVAPQKGDKFRQINRFLEMVEDILPHLDRTKLLQIVDFGCGKGYLTFALYYFLTAVKGFKVCVHGLDLKEDVMQSCQELSNRLGYEGLTFQVGDISEFVPGGGVDLVVALHACNTATDAALAQAVRWKAQVILSAPCCQHELSKQIKNAELDSLLQHGILRERFAALATDALRADLLEQAGYATKVLEFVDPEHTPKNLLIRAVKGNSAQRRENALLRYEACKAALHVSPSLEKLLKNQ